MSTIIELMLNVNDRDTQFYYHKDTKIFDRQPISSIQLKELEKRDKSEDIKVPYVDDNNCRFLTYDEIDHKDLMSLFVKECVDDKEMRKRLFYVLRRTDYVDPFVEALRELDLYDDYEMFSENVYEQIFFEWVEKNELTELMA